MNTHERTISDALRAYGEGLEMTTQDVERLEQQLDHTRQTRRQDRRGRIWQGAVAACAVTGVVLGALALRNDLETPQPATPAPITLEDLRGIWRVEDPGFPGWLWHFFDEGVRRTARPGDLFGSTGQTVSLSPGGFTIADVDPGCSAGFTASISDEGRMVATLTSAEPLPGGSCEPLDGEVWSLTRVSPVSPAGTAMRSAFPSKEPRVVDTTVDLTGVWLLQGTGTVLAVSSAGRYVVDDVGTSSEKEEGAVSLRGSEVLFTALDDPDCATRYSMVRTGGNVLEASLAVDSCGRLGDSSDTWIRLN